MVKTSKDETKDLQDAKESKPANASIGKIEKSAVNEADVTSKSNNDVKPDSNELEKSLLAYSDKTSL